MPPSPEAKAELNHGDAEQAERDGGEECRVILRKGEVGVPVIWIDRPIGENVVKDESGDGRWIQTQQCNDGDAGQACHKEATAAAEESPEGGEQLGEGPSFITGSIRGMSRRSAARSFGVVVSKSMSVTEVSCSARLAVGVRWHAAILGTSK